VIPVIQFSTNSADTKKVIVLKQEGTMNANLGLICYMTIILLFLLMAGGFLGGKTVNQFSEMPWEAVFDEPGIN